MPKSSGKRADRRHFLDGVGARTVAAGIFAAAVAYLAFAHNAEKNPANDGSRKDDPAAAAYEACVADAYAAIDEMQQDSGLTAQQVSMFKRNVKGRCHDRIRSGSLN